MAPPENVPVHTTRVSVRSYELDSFAHANHTVLLNYLEHARFQTLAAGGFNYAALRERGWGVFVVRIEVDYVKEARLGDELDIHTWAASARRTSVVMAQEAVRADDPGTVVVRARVTAVWVGPDRRPIPVPEEVRAVFGLPRAGTPAP